MSERGPATIARRSARRWWRLPAQILVTALALYVIGRNISWRDRASLEDGSQVVVVARQADSVTIRLPGAADATPHEIPADSVVAFHAGVGSTLSRIRPGWVFAYFLCLAVAAVLLVVRWRYLMAWQGAAPPVGWCAHAWARSQVINLLPFGQLGGDAYRVERSGRWLGGRAAAAGVVAAERMVGFGALLAIAAAGLIFSGLIDRDIGAALGLFLGLVVGVRLLAGRPIGRHLAALGGRLSGQPTRWGRSLASAVGPIAGLLRHQHRLPGLLLLSTVIHLLASLSFAIVDRSLGMTTPVWCFLVAVPAISMAQFLPVHVAGIGIMEGGLWLFLGPWAGHTPEAVVALSATVRLLGLLWLLALAASFLGRTTDPTVDGTDSTDVESDAESRPFALQPGKAMA